MLGNTDAVASLAVKDLAVARQFYTGILGLTESGGDGEELLTLKSGSSEFNVYRSQYAGTNQATAMTWVVATLTRRCGRSRPRASPSSTMTCRA